MKIAARNSMLARHISQLLFVTHGEKYATVDVFTDLGCFSTIALVIPDKML